MRLSFFRKTLILLGILSLSISTAFAGTSQVNDLFYTEQSYLQRMSVTEAWKTTIGSHHVVVALLDAGFDLDHEDLQGQYWINESETPSNKKDDDKNGYEDDIQGWDFVDGDADPSPDTSDPSKDLVISHGTLLAGIIGATTNNTKGIAGINQAVSIMPLRVLDKNGVGTSARVKNAMRYAVENGADVINLSFTLKSIDPQLQETIRWAFGQGVVIVAAVGNDNANLESKPVYPSCYDTLIGANLVIGVAGLDQHNRKASFSNYGKTCTDLSAPATDIFGAVYHDATRLLFSTSYGGPWEGTSVAAPMVTGAVALLKAKYPSLSPDQIRNILRLSADPLKEGTLVERQSLGSGSLNIARALEMGASFAGVFSAPLVQKTFQPSSTFVLAQAGGSKPLVYQVNEKGIIASSFSAYNDGFLGGVRLAMGDVDGDGKEEIVTGAGPGGGPQVRIFDQHGKVSDQFFAYAQTDRNGIVVTTGDVNGDGIEEILVMRDTQRTGEIRVFNRKGQLLQAFYPFGKTSLLMSFASANMDQDVAEEILIGYVTKQGPVVRVLDGVGAYEQDISIQQPIINQLFVSAGDMNGDGQNDVVVSAGAGNAPLVAVYGINAKEQSSFLAYDSRLKSGLSVQVADRDQNGRAEIYTAPLQGGGPQVRVFDTTGVIGGFFVGDPSVRSGLHLGM